MEKSISFLPHHPPEKSASSCLKILPLKVTRMEVMALPSNETLDANKMGKKKKECIKSKVLLSYCKIFAFYTKETE